MTRRHQSGFTLLETAVVGVLATIIISIAVPKIQPLLDFYRLAASANLVATELNAGRTLAVSRNWLYETDSNQSDNTIQIVDPDDSNNNPRTVRHFLLS
jgi:Tfp pilus assembly protein FimT